ncbi:MAG TPA: condensation domain-containing protein, partial [Ktedonobacteraceae bacterium]|nr:condensation domain-containing protein [Ktedonobacteraceae bacterium]
MYSEAIEDIYPLSSMQQGMLFHSLYSQGSGVYVEVFLCTLHGHIPYALFERAWQQVVNRHQVLRTAFLWEDIDEPLQVVHAHVPVHLTLDDVRALDPEEQRTYIQSLVQDEHHQGFDLTEAPLLRLRLVQLTDTRHTLVWCFHHIILDGWSVPLLLKEVFTFFEAYCLGRDASLPLPKPYSEYIAWLSQRENQEEQSFWQRTLEGFTEPTPLTMAHTVPPSSRPAENAEQRLSLSREATRALRDLARQERLTLNTLLLGAWALLLGYYSGQDEVLFGT